MGIVGKEPKPWRRAYTDIVAGAARFALGKPEKLGVYDSGFTPEEHDPEVHFVRCEDSRTDIIHRLDMEAGFCVETVNLGGIVDDQVLDIAEFNAKYFGTRLFMVGTHRECGALTAALHHEEPIFDMPAIRHVRSNLEPAIQACSHDHHGKFDHNDLCVDAARLGAKRLRKHLNQFHLQEEVRVIAAFFDFKGNLFLPIDDREALMIYSEVMGQVSSMNEPPSFRGSNPLEAILDYRRPSPQTQVHQGAGA